jgi:hypothetical protein
MWVLDEVFGVYSYYPGVGWTEGERLLLAMGTYIPALVPVGTCLGVGAPLRHQHLF